MISLAFSCFFLKPLGCSSVFSGAAVPSLGADFSSLGVDAPSLGADVPSLGAESIRGGYDEVNIINLNSVICHFYHMY